VINHINEPCIDRIFVTCGGEQVSNTFIAVDWGTTNRRCFLIEEGVVVRTERDDHGVTAIEPGDYPAQVAGIRSRLGDLPLLMAGMVGSTIGWQAAPYVPVAAGMEELASGFLRIDERTMIVPGVSVINGRRADVMRGEEVQLLGAVAAGLAPENALLAQPGTHCKWVTMREGRISDFSTAMTGEMFALLRKHSILARQLTHAVEGNASFREGVDDAARGNLLANLFQVRAGTLMGLRDDAEAASYCSGLLIGADVAAQLDASDHTAVYLLADPALGALYAAAIEARGCTPHFVDSHAAFVAGIIRLGTIFE
jgi:2-dehydro-3-deoxygalactonokinase